MFAGAIYYMRHRLKRIIGSMRRRARISPPVGTQEEAREAAREAPISLLELIKALQQGEKHIQVAEGTRIAQVDHGSTATVTMSVPPEEMTDYPQQNASGLG
jgi:hypothetical protein